MKQQHSPAQEPEALEFIWKRLANDVAWLEKTSPRRRDKIRDYYKHRVLALEQRIGGGDKEVMKNEHGFVGLWFGEKLKTERVCVLASLEAERMLFVCDWRKTQTRLRNIAHNLDKQSFFFALDIFIKHFLEHGHKDGTLGLTMNFNDEEGSASLVIATLLPTAEHQSLMIIAITAPPALSASSLPSSSTTGVLTTTSRVICSYLGPSWLDGVAFTTSFKHDVAPCKLGALPHEPARLPPVSVPRAYWRGPRPLWPPSLHAAASRANGHCPRRALRHVSPQQLQWRLQGHGVIADSRYAERMPIEQLNCNLPAISFADRQRGDWIK